MSTALKIVKLDQGNLQDIPLMLRRLADALERGEVPKLEQAVMVGCTEGGEIRSWQWGDCPSIQQAVGLLNWGIHYIIAGD